jgi:hypothetical protein
VDLCKAHRARFKGMATYHRAHGRTLTVQEWVEEQRVKAKG